MDGNGCINQHKKKGKKRKEGVMCTPEQARRAEKLAAEFAAGIKAEQAFKEIRDLLPKISPTPGFGRGGTVTLSCEGNRTWVQVHLHPAGSAGKGINFQLIS